MLFISFETVGNIPKEPIKACMIDKSHGYSITKNSNWIAVISRHPRNPVLIT